MADYVRYVARTEAWARDIEEDEDIVGSNGRVRAYAGDVHVVQNLRGETFSYVMTRDDFLQDWRSPQEVDTEHATSETGADELPGATPSPEEDNPVDNAPDNTAGIATVGTAAENATPAEPGEGETADDVTPDSQGTAEDSGAPVSSLTASAPTGAGPNDGDVQGVATTGDGTPQVGDSMSPVQTNPDPSAAAAPAGSAAGESSAPDAGADLGTGDAPSTTPTQSVVAGETDPDNEATATSADTGGDAGATPTPSPVLAGESEGTANVSDEPAPTEAPADTTTEAPADAVTDSPADPPTDTPRKTVPAKRANP